jgi:hypothetical protein
MVNISETIPIRKFRAVKLKHDYYENADEYLKSAGLVMNNPYAILGEYGNSDHYIILDVRTGTILRGYFHLDRFEDIPEEDL